MSTLFKKYISKHTQSSKHYCSWSQWWSRARRSADLQNERLLSAGRESHSRQRHFFQVELPTVSCRTAAHPRACKKQMLSGDYLAHLQGKVASNHLCRLRFLSLHLWAYIVCICTLDALIVTFTHNVYPHFMQFLWTFSKRQTHLPKSLLRIFSSGLLHSEDLFFGIAVGL